MATPSSRTVEVNFNEAVCVYKADSQTEVIVGYESRTFGDGEIRRRESLTRLKTTAYTYLLRTKPSGERVVLRDPASVWVLSNGVDPSNGDTVEVKPAYVLAGSELLVRYTDAGEGKLEREIVTGGEGGRIVCPKANQSIRKFDWDPASFGTFWSFNHVRVQTLELIVPDVFLLDEGIKCTYRLGLSYKWNGVHGIKQLLSQGGNDPTPLLVAAARIDLTAQKGDGTGPRKELSRVAGWSGMELESCVVLACDEEVTPEEQIGRDYVKAILEQKAAVQKRLFEAEVDITILSKRSEQWATNLERMTQVKKDYMMAMNAAAKGAGGRDRGYSRVVACCCCSVASKVSASIWGQGEGGAGGGGSLNQLVDDSAKVGVSGSASAENAVDTSVKIKWSDEIEKPPAPCPAPAPYGGGYEPAPPPYGVPPPGRYTSPPRDEAGN